MSDYTKPSGGGKWVFLLLLLLVGGLGYLGYSLVGGGSSGPEDDPASANGGSSAKRDPGGSSAAPAPAGDKVVINIAYGTEKKTWLKWAKEEFSRTEAGRRIEPNLIGMGSVEGARAVLHGPGETPIHVWSPASSAYRAVFENEWEIKTGRKRPILHSENLALSPMVFVMWKERADALPKDGGGLTFQGIDAAMHAEGGWRTLAEKPEWGFFKFSHTHPNKSNSGLLTLVLMAYDFHGKQRGLTLSDITDPKFQTWLRKFESGVARPSGQLSHSTGTLMREMVLRGPSSYDALMVYENLAIDYLRAARGRWGELTVTYPKRNMWNENPYYVLDVPWSNKEHRRAAREFLEFLMSERIQRRALDSGFRPGNPSVPIRFPESPFVRYQQQGLRIDVPSVCEPPTADVLTNLLASFQRIER